MRRRHSAVEPGRPTSAHRKSPGARVVRGLVIATLVALAGCGRHEPVAAVPAAAPAQTASNGDATVYRMQMQRQPDFKAMQAIGRMLFSDATLSGSGTLSCASCHSPDHAYGPPNSLSVQLGGVDGKLMGTRAAPSLRYMQNVPPFTEHHFDEDIDESVDQGPAGGHTWDGRASSAHEQAEIPLLSPVEMGNTSRAAVVEAVRKASYAPQFRQVFGDDALDDVDRGFKWATLALEMFQQDPAEFYPYSSKYDAVLRGQATLSAQETRGLAVFNDENKGNCASCHQSAKSANTGTFPAFSDFGFIAVGVPRNRTLDVNRDPAYFDLGLCGPERQDLKDHPEYCGAFRTPSLRNVATRHAFFHNGVFHSLEEALRFYAERDTRPEKWYPRKADGSVAKFDDLPAHYHENINTDPPFDRKRGQQPAFTERDIQDMVAFLNTLTDGYEAPHTSP